MCNIMAFWQDLGMISGANTKLGLATAKESGPCREMEPLYSLL